MKLGYTIVSETGLQRSNNEDAVLFKKPGKPWLEQCLGTLAIVSDGMGGYQRGEKASAMVVNELSKQYFKGIGQPAEKLREAAIKANNEVALEGIASSQKMGATCTAVAILKDQLHFLHIGDSRAYLLQNGQLRQMTRDHTAANEMAVSGIRRNSEHTMYYNPHALTRAMGVEASKTCLADVFSLPNSLDPGDCIFLCSDGLYRHIKDQELQVLLEQRSSLKEASDRLVKLVLQRGASDNFSFILIEYE